MSRIGRLAITLPPAVKVTQEAGRVVVEGPKGTLSLALARGMTLTIDAQKLSVQRASDEPSAKALHGLTRALLANMVQGTATGFSKQLEIVGVGYRAQLQGKQVSLQVGLSHPVLVPIPEGITVEVPIPTSLVIKGADRQLVGQFAANLRRIAPPEPYKGKGIKYAGEVIRRKAGKAATGAKASG